MVDHTLYDNNGLVSAVLAEASAAVTSTEEALKTVSVSASPESQQKQLSELREALGLVENDPTKIEAISDLAGQLGARATPVIMAAIEQSSQVSVRAGLANVLRSLGTDAIGAAPLLEKSVRWDQNAEIRRSAADTLGLIGPVSQDSIEVLVDELEQAPEDPLLQIAAARALGNILDIGGVAFNSLTHEVGQEHPNDPFGLVAAEALWSIYRHTPPNTAFQYWIEELQEDGRPIVRHAANAIAQEMSNPKLDASQPRLESALSESEIIDALDVIGREWSLNGDRLEATFETPDYDGAMKIAQKIHRLAEDIYHHPIVTVGWGRVEVQLNTFRLQGVSAADLLLAKAIQDSLDPSFSDR